MERVKLSFFGSQPFKKHKGIKKSKGINVDYLSGSQELEDMLLLQEEKNRGGGIHISNQQECLLFSCGILNDVALLPNENILSWGYIKNSDVVKQSKSVLGRAVVGTLLLGPLGGVVGGMSGLGEKSLNSDYFLQIDYLDSNQSQKTLVCGFMDKQLEKVLFIFEQDYKDKYIKLDVEKDSKEASDESIAEKLVKLKELEVQGVITEDEFIKLKSKIIDS